MRFHTGFDGEPRHDLSNIHAEAPLNHQEGARSMLAPVTRRHHPHHARNRARPKRRAQREFRFGLEPLEIRAVPSLTTGIFEIDGNAIDNTPGPPPATGVNPDKDPSPDDWANT